MSWIDGIRTRLDQLIRPASSDARTDEEIRFHVEMETERNVAAGMSQQEARRQAVLAFGSVQGHREQMRDGRTAWAGALTDDCRYAVRHFSRRPLITITMIALLALGMSITTVSFSFMYSYAAAPPAGVASADDLVRVRGIGTQLGEGQVARSFSLEELEEYRKLTGHFTQVAGWASESVPITGGSATGEPIMATATFATANYFPVLGVEPVLGAGLPTDPPADAGSRQVVVIGHRLWERVFAASPGALGETLDINGVAFTIVGVAAPSFRGMNPLEEHVIWLPLEKRRELLPTASTGSGFRAVARLREGISVSAATSAVEVIAARMNPPEESSISVTAGGPGPERSGAGNGVPGSSSMLANHTSDVVVLLSENGDPNYSQDLRLIGAGVSLLGILILLVTGTTVSALLTGLAVGRRREIAVRLALGAHRRRVLRQLLTESLLLAAVAAATALLVAAAFLEISTALLPPLPFAVSINWAAAGFAAAVALAVGLTFGLSPALHATRVGFATALKQSTAMIAAPRASLQKRLIVAQIAFTQPLIVALATFLVMANTEMERGSPTEAAEKVISVTFRSPAPGRLAGDMVGASDGSGDEQVLQMSSVRDAVAALPGVAGAVFELRSVGELSGYSVRPQDQVPGGTREPIRMNGRMALPGYLDVMGMPIREGREFRGDDPSWLSAAVNGRRNRTSSGAAPVTELPIIIGDDLAEALWPGASALGRSLETTDDLLGVRQTLTVVGVVDQPEHGPGVARDTYPVYVPPDPGLVSFAMTLLVRTEGAAQPLMSAIRSTVANAVPGMVLMEMQTLADIQREERRTYFLATGALASGSAIALLLCAIGLYAVVSFAVAQRVGEIAVRMAVGARGRQVAGSFLSGGMRLSVLGMLIGLPLSMLGLRYFMSVPEFGMPPVALGPVAAIAAGGILLVAAAASWIPARRAAGIDPSITLRRE